MNAEIHSAVANRTRPMIWVKELVLFKSIKPVDEIRSIPFTKGLNIVQGQSNDSTEAFESGHGNGKTTLCRLIRYCLGEKSFGQQHVVAEVKHCFPTGYVGAIVEVGGDQWAVLRSLGHRGRDHAQQGVTLPELISAEDAPPYSEFVKRVEEAGLSALSRRDVLSGGQAIQWLHLLALCSRDQESRYDRFWNWRHTRSDSGTPKVSKSDVSVCVRSILGLLDPTEPPIRDRLEELEDEVIVGLRTKIKEKQSEPTFHITRLRTSLSDEMGVRDAVDAPLEQGHLFNVSQVSDVRIQELRNELREIEQTTSPLDRQINLATVQYKELLELQEQQEAAGEVTEDGTAVLLDELDQLRNMQESLLERSVSVCKPGRILFGDCEHVKAHLADIERSIEDEQKKTLPQTSSREQVAAHLAEQAERQGNPLNRIRTKLDELNRQKNGLLERRRIVNGLLIRIPQATTELLKWHRIISGEVQNTELTNLEESERDALDEQAKLKSQLSEVLIQQNDRAKQFGQRFNEIVQRTINSAFKGSILVEDEGLSFRINRERSLAGEAYETLAVLLADIAILVESSTPSVCHPGLLIHDSPREADLNIRLYERMLDVAHSLMAGEEGSVPYQYIVTTTTHPSKSLRASSLNTVTLSSGSGSLFGMQLDIGPPDSDQDTLFDGTEET